MQEESLPLRCEQAPLQLRGCFWQLPPCSSQLAGLPCCTSCSRHVASPVQAASAHVSEHIACVGLRVES